MVLLNTRQNMLLRAALKNLEGWQRGVTELCRLWKGTNDQLPLTTFRREEYAV